VGLGTCSTAALGEPALQVFVKWRSPPIRICSARPPDRLGSSSQIDQTLSANAEAVQIVAIDAPEWPI
jgi:hypothetical protein